MAGRAKEIVIVLLRCVVGGVFIYAGVLKALDPLQFAADVDNFRLLPYALSCAVGVYLPWLEILAGAALVIGIWRSGASLLLGAMRPEIGLDIVSGYQCDIVANNPNYNGMLYEERGRRILSHTGEKVIIAPDGQPWIVGTMPVKEFAPDEWHEYRVVVRGNHHQHWIDGHPTADLIDLDEKGRALEGVLGVQVHVGPAMKIQFKDFKIQHLPDNLPLLKAEEHPIPAGSLGVKPQGKLPKDWQPPVYPLK